LSSLGAFLPSLLVCSQPGVDYCERWTECPKHWVEGMQAFRGHFWEAFRTRLQHTGHLACPLDRSTICLDSTCLAPGITRSCELKCNESHSFYFDVPSPPPSALRLIVQSPNRVKFSLRHQERPSLFRNDLLCVTHKAHEDLHWLQVDLHAGSRPPLLPGRWFCSVRGSSLLFRSTVSLSLLALAPTEYAAVVEGAPVVAEDGSARRERESERERAKENEAPPSYDAHMSVSSLMPEQEEEEEEDAWVFIADDSSREGRKQKPRLLGDFDSVDSSLLLSSLSTPPDAEVPNEFLCPISLELMQRPVVAADGFTYEQSAIETWLEGHLRSPLTGQEMTDKTLRPNHTLKAAIGRWLLLQSSVAL